MWIYVRIYIYIYIHMDAQAVFFCREGFGVRVCVGMRIYVFGCVCVHGFQCMMMDVHAVLCVCAFYV